MLSGAGGIPGEVRGGQPQHGRRRQVRRAVPLPVECRALGSGIDQEPLRGGKEAGMKGCRPLTDPEIALLTHSFGGTYALRDRAWFVVGLKTGFRIAELLSLRVGDVWQHGRVVDQVTVRRAHMKQQREGRTVPLHPDAKAALAAWVRQLRQQPGVAAQTAVFRSRKGANRAIRGYLKSKDWANIWQSWR
jgi:integrase